MSWLHAVNRYGAEKTAGQKEKLDKLTDVQKSLTDNFTFDTQPINVHSFGEASQNNGSSHTSIG